MNPVTGRLRVLLTGNRQGLHVIGRNINDICKILRTVDYKRVKGEKILVI
ncbi:hypothetical protein SATMO3_36340 [Sporomusa aerivorans]